MKEVSTILKNGDKEYKLVFNLNAMQAIQEEYRTLEAWGDLTDAKDGEPNIKALIFGMAAMINEAIEIENEDNGTNKPLLTLRQVGRLLTDIGIDNATAQVNETVIKSAGASEDDSKNG